MSRGPFVSPQFNFSVGQVLTASQLNEYLSAQMDLVGRPPSFRIDQTATDNLVEGADPIIPNFNNVAWDTDAGWDTGSMKYTVQVDGLYEFRVTALIKDEAGGIAGLSQWAATIEQDGSVTGTQAYITSGAGGGDPTASWLGQCADSITVTALVRCVAGDLIWCTLANPGPYSSDTIGDSKANYFEGIWRGII